jgi:hypothetical protein
MMPQRQTSGTRLIIRQLIINEYILIVELCYNLGDLESDDRPGCCNFGKAWRDGPGKIQRSSNKRRVAALQKENKMMIKRKGAKLSFESACPLYTVIKR